MKAHDVLWIGLEGHTIEEIPRDPSPGGVILFARNLDPDPRTGPARCHALIQGLQRRWGQERPLAVALDQEGGPVSRLKAWVGPTPALRTLWTKGGAEACRTWGRLWGWGLRLLGFQVNFAPVADRWDGHIGTGLGDRCASEDPVAVARAAGAFLQGLEAEGVRGCLKHYPGLGGTTVDSHQARPRLEDPDQLAQNLWPFRALAHVDRWVMVAHLQTPTTEGRPASLHRGTVADNPWGIRARWIPDDLEMGGCADVPWAERVRWALEAGHEALLVCQTRAGVEACAQALLEVPSTAWRSAAERFGASRVRLRCPTFEPFDASEWARWVETLQREAAHFL